MKRTILSTSLAPGLLVIALAGIACEDLSIVDPEETFSARICRRIGDECLAIDDTTLLVGESMSAASEAEYVFGSGIPLEVVWGAGDTAVLEIDGLPEGEVQVVGRIPGSSILVARINEDFLDTITVHVVDTGAVRWRRALAPGAQATEIALSDSGDIVAVDGNNAVLRLGPMGDTVWLAGGACQPSFGPAVGLDGAYVSGNGCTQRYSIDGVQVWSNALGSADGGMAVAANGELVALAFGGGVVTLSRYGLTGNLVWRDTLAMGAEATAPMSGPSIATNGDIYVPWYTAADTAWLSRYTSAGVERWAIQLPAEARHTTPAVVRGNVFVVHRLGVAARDSTGQVVFDRAFTDVFPGGPAERAASSPVIDAAGNLYTLSDGGLFSLDPAGAVRWVADSIQNATTGSIVPAPAVLTGNGMVSFCGTAICGITPATGIPSWRSPALASTLPANTGGVIATPSGLLLVKVGDEILALWHRRPMASSGWPARGAAGGRTGRALQ